jgi:hypothetical protein
MTLLRSRILGSPRKTLNFAAKKDVEAMLADAEVIDSEIGQRRYGASGPNLKRPQKPER